MSLRIIYEFLKHNQKRFTFAGALRKMATTTTADDKDEFIEGVVCKVSDLKENELKTFDLDEGKVLVVKQNGVISAIGSKCTHYGAPLGEGSALGVGRVRCQWHGACFSLATGDIEEFPGVDSLPCYKVTIEDNNVKVRARRSELKTNKRLKPMVKRNECERQKTVVVGGGPAGAVCVETLRQEGYGGQITLVCKENCLPYDRVRVSKAMDFEIEQAQLRTAQFYEEYDIDVLKGVEATAVNTCTRTVTISNGKKLEYDRLFIATGSKPRKLDIPGANLKNVIVLRNYEDSQYTNAQLAKDKEVVVLGSSFVAMEVANYCVDKVKKVTVVARGDVPFEPLLGSKVGAAFLKLFKEKGVHFIAKSGMTRVNGNCEGKIVSVELIDGTVLKADLVIMGVGGTFNTEFLKTSGIDIKENGSIETDEYLQTNVPGVYVGGDIAYAPVWSHNNVKATIGHFALSSYHGKIAALNMLGKQTKLRSVPFFWIMVFGKGIRYAGYGEFDDVVYVGNVDEYKFVAFYLKDGVVVSTAACGMDPVVSQFAEHLSQGKKLLREDLKADPLAWTKK